MSKLNGPKFSGVYANMAVVMSDMGLSEKEICKRILKKCNEVIRGKKQRG